MKMRLTSVLILAFGLAVCGPASASIIYDNGPINGTIQGYTISAGLAVADSFVSDGPATITAFDAGIWVDYATTPSTITWKILTGGPSWIGGAYCRVRGYKLVLQCLPENSRNYLQNDIYTSTVNGLNVPIGAGTYYLELSSGLSSNGDNLYWDVNNGPSLAYNSYFNPVKLGGVYYL